MDEFVVWEYMQCTTNPNVWLIYDKTGEWICEACDEYTAQQIVREHNAHAEMVESVKSGKESMRSLFNFIQHSLIPFLEVSAPNSEFMKRIDNLKEAANEIPDEIARIDAVLALAEGRTK